MTDMLDPRADTWQRPTLVQPTSITEAPAFWRQIADSERDPVLAADYRRLADMAETYLPMRGGTP